MTQKFEQPEAGSGWAAPESAVQKVEESGEKFSQKVDKMASEIKTKANKAIESTTGAISQAVNYIQGKNSQELLENAVQVVRSHPGKTILASLIFGILVGKALRWRS